MAHALVNIWIHAVWGTKNRLPLIDASNEYKIHEFIRCQLTEANCPVRIINGVSDHIHCLFLLNSRQSISNIIKQIKGSSSRYINRNNLTEETFAWQTGYGAFSVSEPVVQKVFEYIKHQKQHHRESSLIEKYEAF